MIENNEIITTDTEGIYMRDYQDTLVPRAFGFDNRTFTMNVYQYAHNPMELYEANQNQPRLNIMNYANTDLGEVAHYKGIPMMYRFNPVIREMMMTGNYRIRYRGCSKTHYGYRRAQGYCLAEYADTFAIYPK
tara:strand:- start:455 stop:853 length:399 start_codon:yes stop_codon:yes gene_type:complete